MSKDMIFNLSDDDLTLAKTKKSDKNKLSFAVLLKYFELENHYPKHIKFIDPLMLNTIANQLNISPSLINNFDWEGRSTERFRQEIRGILGYRAATQGDINNLKLWLFVNVLPNAVKRSQRIEYAYTYFRENKIEPFTLKELERHIRSAHREFEQQLFKSIYSGLIDKTKLQMDEFLSDDPDGVDDDEIDDNKLSDGSNTKFKHIKLDIPGVKLKNVSRAIQKINCLKQLALPEHLFSCLSTKLIKKYYTRVMAERPSGMREHNPHTRYATFSIFCYFRLQLLVDSLADLFMKLTHQLKRKSESFVDKKILTEVKCVNGKFDILYKLSVSALENPTGIIQDKIYPEVGQDTLSNLVKELYFKGKWYQTQVHLKMHSLYSHAHRRTLLTLLDSLSFKTNLNDSKPLLEAINIIKFNRDSSHEYYSDDIDVPVKNVIPNEWLSLVIIKSENGFQQINRINYEISVLQELKKQLNCKMIWIDGSFRYRDPNHDLPKDFDENREHYYGLLGLPLNADEFIAPRKKELHNNLTSLNDSILHNKKVEIINKDGGHIKISPYEPQAEPVNIKKLHQAIKKEYGTINLIDILKESDLQIEFTNLIQTVASRENIPRETLQFRILLCLYAIGTNTGLKCVSSANEFINYDDLRYVKRRFITVENVRLILVEIINKILDIRDPRIWGTATTSVSCDSKKISVWDQNLMVEWHARYRGRGVMVYWHVDENALCIYSQLKTCSSSEVGSMLKGILQHCTNMEMNQVYSDTHGQSTLAFGVSELLDFDLLPRLKNIYVQKLYYPSPSQKGEYKNLELILKEPINWKLIEDHYDEAIKHVIALKIGTMEPDIFVRRFSKDNYQHPVYRAIIEIGKVSKTNFLCRYLMIEELRIEIHEAQNVVERLNSVMGFIFYGKLGEISTNIKEYQELGIVCLHLLQACMAYINTLIFQKVLSQPEWQNILTPEDKRALNVLFHSHINPYGLFPLDLSKRLGIAAEIFDHIQDDLVPMDIMDSLIEEEVA
jgi:TnpA family transposase